MYPPSLVSSCGPATAVSHVLLYCNLKEHQRQQRLALHSVCRMCFETEIRCIAGSGDLRLSRLTLGCSRDIWGRRSWGHIMSRPRMGLLLGMVLGHMRRALPSHGAQGDDQGDPGGGQAAGEPAGQPQRQAVQRYRLGVLRGGRGAAPVPPLPEGGGRAPAVCSPPLHQSWPLQAELAGLMVDPMSTPAVCVCCAATSRAAVMTQQARGRHPPMPHRHVPAWLPRCPWLAPPSSARLVGRCAQQGSRRSGAGTPG